MGFAPFGEVSVAGMAVVDAIYAGYGELPDQGRITTEGNRLPRVAVPEARLRQEGGDPKVGLLAHRYRCLPERGRRARTRERQASPFRYDVQMTPAREDRR